MWRCTITSRTLPTSTTSPPGRHRRPRILAVYLQGKPTANWPPAPARSACLLPFLSREPGAPLLSLHSAHIGLVQAGLENAKVISPLSISNIPF